MESSHQDFVAISNPYSPNIKTTLTTTVSGVLTTDSTTYHVPDYTDEQFYADLRKSRKALDRMARQAERDYKRGKTRKFPAEG